jgi:hypothetical protein
MKPLCIYKRRYKDNIGMDFKGLGYDTDIISYAQVRDQWKDFVKTGMNLWVP